MRFKRCSVCDISLHKAAHAAKQYCIALLVQMTVGQTPAGSAGVSLTGAAPLTNFLAIPPQIFNLSLMTRCFCSQTSILIAPHRTRDLCPKCLGLPVLCPLPPVLSQEPCHQLPPAYQPLLCCPGKFSHSLTTLWSIRAALKVWSLYNIYNIYSLVTILLPPTNV